MEKYDNSPKVLSAISDLKRKCKHCGHTMIVDRCEKIICSHCGHYVYKTDKIEFKTKLIKQIKH